MTLPIKEITAAIVNGRSVHEKFREAFTLVVPPA